MIESDAISASIDRSQHLLLVVDDNPATRYSTSRVLQVAGFRIAEAGSGQEALDRVADGASAVVLDVHLPDISGFEVCRRLRASPATARLPIVHLSAEFTRNEDRVAGLDAGADAYLVHPVEPAVLVATLQALVRARTAEDRLRRSELRFRAIYDHAPTGIMLLNAAGLIEDVNPAMTRLLGTTAPGLLGRNLLELAPPESRDIILRQTSGGGPGPGTWSGQFPLLHAGGAKVHLEWNMSDYVEPGLRIAIASDAGEKVRLEEQRLDVLQREQAARATAERHSRTKDDFIAVLSHELRTPLNAIMGWVAVLMRRNPAAEQLKGLAAIERNVKSQARIISDILDVARINSGKLRLERENVDPASLVENSLASLQTLMEDQELQVQLDVDRARQPAWLDPGRFQQIFWNLMTNAIKFSRRGGVIRVTLDRAGDRLILRVQDYGQGIRPEFLPRLFDRFSQSDAPGQRVHGGLGLGLSIVSEMAELHGGSARAESAGPGQGTTFEVELQVSQADGESFAASQPGDLQPGGEQAAENELGGLDILVVDDDADACEMLTVILSDRGASVRTASDFDSALSALRDAAPDLLLSDIGLPVRDGYELIREVRRHEQLTGARRLPALALTAFARSEDRQRALEAGFDDHFPKPLNAHALVSAIVGLRLDHAARAAPAPGKRMQ